MSCSGPMVLEPSKEELSLGREVQKDLFSDAGFDEIRLPRRPEEVDRLRNGRSRNDARWGRGRNPQHQSHLPFGESTLPARAPAIDAEPRAESPKAEAL